MFDKQVGHVQVLTKAFTILNIIGESREPLTLTQIVNLSGMSKTTVHRLLKSLVAHQYVSIDRHSEYVLGSQIVCLGAKALHTSVASTGYSIARALYDATKLTVCICTLSGFEIVYLQKIAPRITIKQDVGSTRPAYCTALGKCQLAYLPEEELDRLIETHGLPPMTPNTVCDVAQFKESLKEARRLGYAVNRHEANPQVDGVAAPIFDFSGKCIFHHLIETLTMPCVCRTYACVCIDLDKLPVITTLNVICVMINLCLVGSNLFLIIR